MAAQRSGERSITHAPVILALGTCLALGTIGAGGLFVRAVGPRGVDCGEAAAPDAEDAKEHTACDVSYLITWHYYLFL